MLIFEWDVNKELKNINKHGISFKIASRVFLDDNVLIFPDELHSADEDRSIAIGMVERVIFVVYTERGNAIRIISARRATKSEELLYEENLYT